uniref:Uncharacterized protein n=1 Tax=Aegilops tauschii subsp. strangulata TaxID=200361 RepID=A0A453M7B2_AEGTS
MLVIYNNSYVSFVRIKRLDGEDKQMKLKEACSLLQNSIFKKRLKAQLYRKLSRNFL